MSEYDEALARLPLYNTSREDVPYTFIGPDQFGYVTRLPDALHDVATVVGHVSEGALQIVTKGVRWIPEAIRARATGNVAITSGLEDGAILDGVTLSTGDFVFLGMQSDPRENGIYTVVASGLALRASFADSADELALIAFTLRQGTDGIGEQWTLPLDEDEIVIGVTDLNFSLFGWASEETIEDGAIIDGGNF